MKTKAITFASGVLLFLLVCGMCSAQALMNVSNVERQVKVAAGGTSMQDQLTEKPQGAHANQNTFNTIGNEFETADGTMQAGKVVAQAARATGSSHFDGWSSSWEMGEDLSLSASSLIPVNERENPHIDNAWATGQVWNQGYVWVIGGEDEHYRHRFVMTIDLETPEPGARDNFEYECYRGIGRSWIFAWWQGTYWRVQGERRGSNGSVIPINLTITKQTGESCDRSFATYEWTSGELTGFPVETEGLSSWTWVWDGVDVRTASPGGPYESSQSTQILRGGLKYQGTIQVPSNPWE